MSQAPGGHGLRYAPGLDGVRALAVLAVVAYHIGTTSPLHVLPGGYLGVDVFFVLSGYLITSLLLVEARQQGRISIKNFYVRRARRLLPALYAMLLAVTALGAFWLPQQAARLRGDLLASIFYVQNWWLVAQSSSYFASVGDRPPLLTHLWSLAVEEQYYVVWPLVLIAFFAMRARRTLMLAIVLTLVAASTAAGQLLYHPYSDPSRVYYGTDTRALAPLLGAGLAIAVRPWLHRPRLPVAGRLGLDMLGVLGLAGLGITAASVRDTDELLYRGGFLGIAVLAAAVVAAAGHPASTLARVLATQPLRYLGERSYAIYLWHWPVCLVTRPGLDIPITGWANVAVRLAASIALAEISYHLIEKPIRRHGFLATLRRPRHTPQPRSQAPARPPAPIRSPAPAGPPVRAVGRHGVATAIRVGYPGVPTVSFPPVTLRSDVTAEYPVVTHSTGYAHSTGHAHRPGGAQPSGYSHHAPPRRPLVPLVRTALLTVALVGGGSVAAVGLVAAASRPASGVALGPDTTEQPTPTATARPGPKLPWGSRVEFFGDSQGESLLAPDVRPPDLATFIDAVDATTPGCGLVYGLITLGNGQRQDHSACAAWSDYWTSRVKQDQPALSVVMIGPWDIYDVALDDASPMMAFGSPAWDANFRSQLAKGIGILRASGGAVALALTTCYRPPSDFDNWWATVGDERGRHINDLMVEATDSYATGVYIVEPPAVFCDNPAIARDPTYRIDGVHYTARGASLYFHTLLQQILGPQTTPTLSTTGSAGPTSTVEPTGSGAA